MRLSSEGVDLVKEFLAEGGIRYLKLSNLFLNILFLYFDFTRIGSFGSSIGAKIFFPDGLKNSLF